MPAYKTLIVLAFALNLVFSTYTPTYLGKFSSENPAFFTNDVNSDSSNIFISSFSGSPFTSGKIWYLENFGQKLTSDLSAVQTN